MSRTAYEAGWHISRYNISAPVPGSDITAIANLFAGTCGAYTSAECFLLSELNGLEEGHPILKRFSERGLIVNFDERAALEALGRAGCSCGDTVDLTICPTMACNFDCPYCFEFHRNGRMSEKTRGEIVNLAARMLKASGARRLNVTWFGGEPLLAPDIIEDLSRQLISLAETACADYSASIITNGYFLTDTVVQMLGRCGVIQAQVTLDGVGDDHDRTRHLTGGGATFERITDNLRSAKLPFRVDIRHNVHEGNRDRISELKAFIEALAKESGNPVTYYAANVSGNNAFDERGTDIRPLCGTNIGDTAAQRDALSFSCGRGTYCGANSLYNVGVDEVGCLYKCWEDVDKADHSFGTASKWDPANPIATADYPDNLTCYLNTGLPFGDAECWECVWLPMCVGGCPNKRLYYARQCLPYKEIPEKYVLALYDRLISESRDMIRGEKQCENLQVYKEFGKSNP